jgi:hypothetical protein
MRSAPPPSRPRINFQAQADELGDNYFVSFAQLRRRSGEHWTFHAVCVGLLAALAWQARRFKRDYVAHSFWTILDGFLMLALLTALLALLLPRQRDPSESSLPSTMLPHEATIFQKGRLPIVSEFRHFVRGNSEWWVRTVAGLLARYIEKPDDSSDSSDDSSDDSDRGGGGYSEEEAMARRRRRRQKRKRRRARKRSDEAGTAAAANPDAAIQDLAEVTERVLALVRRIVRNSDAPKTLRKMLRAEAADYLAYLTNDGLIFNWIASLPGALGDLDFDPPRDGPPKPRLPTLMQSRRYRLWLKTMLAAHLFKRHLWSTVPPAYPAFSTQCIVCQDRDVEVAFIGCGHAVTCGDCGRMCLYGRHNSAGLCPLCRTPIEMLSDDKLGRKDA